MKPLTTLAHERNSHFKCKQHTIHEPWGPKNITTQWWSTRRHFKTFVILLLLETLKNCVFVNDLLLFHIKYVWATCSDIRIKLSGLEGVTLHLRLSYIAWPAILQLLVSFRVLLLDLWIYIAFPYKICMKLRVANSKL